MQKIIEQLQKLMSELPEEIRMNWFLYNDRESELSCACGIKPSDFLDVLLHCMQKSPAMRDTVLAAADIFKKQSQYKTPLEDKVDKLVLPFPVHKGPKS